MAFIEGTKIFTNSGFKNIEDISGRDKVLVRNFLGDAEFIQPFALKKTQYDGEIVKVGANNWNFSVTPDHVVVYDSGEYLNRPDYRFVPAGELKTTKYDRIIRKFRYLLPDDQLKEVVKVRDDFGTRYVTIDYDDWYKLVAYMLTRGFIRRASGKNVVFIYTRDGRLDEDIKIVGGILDKYGIPWSLSYSAQPMIVISSRNTLAARLITRLGSRKRKEMYLPNRMVYRSSREQIRTLIETIIDNSIGENTERGKSYTLSTTNKKLIDSLTVLGTVGGYSMTTVLKDKAGTETKYGKTKKDSYNLKISSGHDTYRVGYTKKSNYHGKVYEIDLFDGQVYAKGGSMPVWVNPK